jgi:hypothetical protein
MPVHLVFSSRHALLVAIKCRGLLLTFNTGAFIPGDDEHFQLRIA